MSVKPRIVIVFVSICAATTLAETIYVDDSAGSDGRSWQTACTYLQDALTLASGAAKPAEIRIAQGIYRPDEDTLHPGGTGNRAATSHSSMV